jgi:hypothetical protein
MNAMFLDIHGTPCNASMAAFVSAKPLLKAVDLQRLFSFQFEIWHK